MVDMHCQIDGRHPVRAPSSRSCRTMPVTAKSYELALFFSMPLNDSGAVKVEATKMTILIVDSNVNTIGGRILIYFIFSIQFVDSNATLYEDKSTLFSRISDT